MRIFLLFLLNTIVYIIGLIVNIVVMNVPGQILLKTFNEVSYSSTGKLLSIVGGGIFYPPLILLYFFSVLYVMYRSFPIQWSVKNFLLINGFILIPNLFFFVFCVGILMLHNATDIGVGILGGVLLIIALPALIQTAVGAYILHKNNYIQ